MFAPRTSQPSREVTCATVVTFRPDSGLPDRLSQVLRHAHQMVIVDNGSGSEFTAILESAQRAGAAKLISNPENRGVAAALNQGIELALKHGCTWAMLFDQDSTALPELLHAAQRAYEGFPIPSRVAVIGADHDHPFHFKKRLCFPRESAYREMRTVITSGSLIDLSICKNIGGFREDLFIDSVDDEVLHAGA